MEDKQSEFKSSEYNSRIHGHRKLVSIKVDGMAKYKYVYEGSVEDKAGEPSPYGELGEKRNKQ